MIIRLEETKDYREVENLTREAFWNVYRPGCSEHYVLNQYRTNPDFIPELDFVMEDNDKIIGHVMFSKAEITLDDGNVFPSWTFGPISILLPAQGLFRCRRESRSIRGLRSHLHCKGESIPRGATTKEEYKQMMQQYFPMLKRWKK